MTNQLRCTECNKTYPLHDPRWKCDCGGLLDLDFQPVFDIAKISARKPGMWRYREALPIENDANIVSFNEGYTPLGEVFFDGKPVWIKQDHLSLTGSYKDRGAALLISLLKEIGINKVVEDSSGNAGCSIAAYCARAKSPAIFMSRPALTGKTGSNPDVWRKPG